MNISSITQYHREKWIDLETSNYLIWKPSISYQNEVNQKVESEQFYLYPGYINWVRKMALTVKCNFDYTLFPNDEQSCDIIPRVQ